MYKLNLILSLTIISILSLGRPAAHAACFGDCNGSNSLTASDIGRINTTILRCAPCPGDVPGGVANGCEAFASGCAAADFNADGCLRASELARANQNILRFQPSGCAPETTPTGGAANPTPTPTETAAQTPTETVALPTETPTENAAPPTDTPVQPTSTVPPTRTPTVNPAVCGNGLLESGETCANCAADCVVANCTPMATPPRTFRVEWAPPPGEPVSVIKVQLGYRSNLMSLPGIGPTPGPRVKNRPSNSATVVNDKNYAVEVQVSRSGSLPEGRLFNIDFDGCQNAAVPTTADLACGILDCASSFGSVTGCTCAVTTP